MTGFVLRGAQVVLRPVEPADAAALDRIRREPDVARWWGDPEPGWLEPEAGVAAYVIEAEGAVVGYAQTYETDDPRRRFAGLDLFVDPAMRGRGRGRDAVETLVEWLHATKHHRIVVDPAAANAPAIAAYARAGFRPVGVLRAYERDPAPGADGSRGWHDGLLMEHVLPAPEHLA